MERLARSSTGAGSRDEYDLVGGSRHGDVRLGQHHTQGTAVTLGDGDVLDAQARAATPASGISARASGRGVILAVPLELWAQRAVHATRAEDLFSG